jgi:hypothetical protein
MRYCDAIEVCVIADWSESEIAQEAYDTGVMRIVRLKRKRPPRCCRPPPRRSSYDSITSTGSASVKRRLVVQAEQGHEWV